VFELSTARLRLLPLPPSLLKLLIESRDTLEAHLGLRPSNLQVPEILRSEYAQALEIWRESAETMTGDYRWLTPWEMIEKDLNQSIGNIGFAGPPNEAGRVFLGYWIDERYQRQGYMTEAVAAITAWAFDTPAVRSVEASAPSDNLASQKVLLKNRFVRDGEYEGHPLFVKRR
jgi:RimJ/RimL family protein N-acetyltransferase